MRVDLLPTPISTMAPTPRQILDNDIDQYIFDYGVVDPGPWPGFISTYNNTQPPVINNDFSEYMWMANMEDFDRQYEEQLLEEEMITNILEDFEIETMTTPSSYDTNPGIVDSVVAYQLPPPVTVHTGRNHDESNIMSFLPNATMLMSSATFELNGNMLNTADLQLGKDLDALSVVSEQPSSTSTLNPNAPVFIPRSSGL